MHNVVFNRRGQSKSTISCIHGLCLASRSKENSIFFDISDRLTTLTAYHNAYILRFADFSVDVNDDNDNDNDNDDDDDRWTD